MSSIYELCHTHASNMSHTYEACHTHSHVTREEAWHMFVCVHVYVYVCVCVCVSLRVCGWVLAHVTVCCGLLQSVAVCNSMLQRPSYVVRTMSRHPKTANLLLHGKPPMSVGLFCRGNSLSCHALISHV